MTWVKITDDILEIAQLQNKKDGKDISGYNLDCNSEMLIQDGYRKMSDDEMLAYNSGYYKIDNNIIVKDTNREIDELASEIYHEIIGCYQRSLDFGVFQIDSEYYGNMAWDKTWTNVVNLFELPPTGANIPERLPIRLYKKKDSKYYNIDTTKNLQELKELLSVLKYHQFSTYQPTKNNLLLQLSNLKNEDDLEGLKILKSAITAQFGDIINEQLTVINYISE